MYKMARKPVPQHVGPTSSAQGITIEDIKYPIVDYQTPSLPTTPLYRSFPERQKHNSSDTFCHMNMDNGRIKTGTSELADFLKSSKPEDFRNPVVLGSVDDLSLNTSGNHKKRRFLRSSTARDAIERVRTQSPLPFRPPHVTPKTTSKGSPYLQIQVDYKDNGKQKGQPLREITDNTTAVSNPNSVNLYQSNEVPKVGTAGATAARQFLMNGSPPPWSPPEPKSSATASMDTYQNFLRTYIEPAHKNPRRMPVLPALRTDFGGPQVKIPQIQHLVPRTLHTPTKEIEILDRTSLVSIDAGSYYGSSTHRQSPKGSVGHARVNSQEHLIGSSVRLDASTTTSDSQTAHQEQLQMRKLLKPGPPPSRALPSLPELHDISTLSGRCTIPPQVAPRPESPMPPSPLEKDEQFMSDRKRREDHVKARKARDMKGMQQRKLQEAIKLLGDDAKVEIREKGTHGSPNASPVSAASKRLAAKRQNSQTRNSQTPTVNQVDAAMNISVNAASAEPHQNNVLQIITHDAPTPPRSPSPLLNPTPGDRSGRISAQVSRRLIPAEALRSLLEESLIRQSELEDRLESMEHKYMILEQALITVLQRTSPHRSESNSIENLLADFRITHPCRGWSEAFPLERDLSQAEH